MKYIKVFTDFRELMEPLNDGERGRLFTAMLAYGADGAEPILKGSERFLWPAARQIIDRETEAYESKVRHLRRGRGPVSGETHAVSEKERSVSEEDKDKDKDKEKEKDKDKDKDKERDKEKEREESLSPKNRCVHPKNRPPGGGIHGREKKRPP